jgi:hypothetical protein
MLLTTEFEPPDVLVATLGGLVRLHDQAALVESVRAWIRRVGPIRLMVRLHEFAGWGASGCVDDDRLWFRDDEGISRIAVVGEPAWAPTVLTLTAQPLRRIPIEYFDDEAAARLWLESGAAPATRLGQSTTG